METFVLAGGCFWCLDAVYRSLDGVVDVVSGLHRRPPQEPELRGRLHRHDRARGGGRRSPSTPT